MTKMDIYNEMPVMIQNVACFYQGCQIRRKRYGKEFRNALEKYESHNNWSYEQMCEYRDERLKEMIQYCFTYVPYYRKMFNERGIDPESINRIDDLKKLPILTKQEIKNDETNFVSRDNSIRNRKIHMTGGTTGSGLAFLTTDQEEAMQWAVWWRYRRKHGIEWNTPCGNLGGKVIVPVEDRTSPYWRINKPCEQIFYSSYHLNSETAKEYANDMKKRNISWIHGYPSNIAMLASYLNEKNLVIPLKWVSIGAENLYDYQRRQIEKAFQVKPIQHYGLTEGVANFSEQVTGEISVDEDFACVEFVEEESGSKKVIGTTLTNHAMPLLRYDTGDFVKESGKNNLSGRIVDEIIGRSNEYIFTSNHTKVGAAAISLVFCQFEKILGAQVVQKSMCEILIKINCMTPLLDDEKVMLIEEMQKRIGKFQIDIEYVHIFEKTKSGKMKFIISEL